MQHERATGRPGPTNKELETWHEAYRRTWGGGFGRDVDDELEAAVNEWVDALTEKKELEERIEVLAEHVLTKMIARKRKHYEASDGTKIDLEVSTKVKAKRPKRSREDDEIDGAVKAARKGLDRLTDSGATVTLVVPGKEPVTLGKGRKRGKGEAN